MPEGTSGRPEQIELRKAWFGRDRNAVDTNLVRFRGLALRYKVAVQEHLFFVEPTSGRRGYGEYKKSFPEVKRQFVMGPINMVRGALEYNLLEEQWKLAEEQSRAPKPRLTKVWRTFVSALTISISGAIQSPSYLRRCCSFCFGFFTLPDLT